MSEEVNVLEDWINIPCEGGSLFLECSNAHTFFIPKYQLEMKSLPWHNSTVITSKQRNAACAQYHIWFPADSFFSPELDFIICVVPTGCSVLSKTSAS